MNATIFAANNFESKRISEQADRVLHRQYIDYLEEQTTELEVRRDAALRHAAYYFDSLNKDMHFSL